MYNAPQWQYGYSHSHYWPSDCQNGGQAYRFDSGSFLPFRNTARNYDGLTDSRRHEGYPGGSTGPPGHNRHHSYPQLFESGPEQYQRDTQSSLTDANVVQSGASATAISPPAQSTIQPFTDPEITLESTRDPTTGVAVVTAAGPKQNITDPDLYSFGVRARRALLPTPGAEERLFSTFRRRPSGFFVVGRVFQICWSEPASDTTTINTVVQNDRPNSAVSANRFGEKVYSKVRRFVVIRQGHDYCSALPIFSYGGQGVAKPGVNKSEHGVVYTGRIAPQPQLDEMPGRGERGMRAQSIRVVADKPEDRLDPMSRIDFAKVHTVHHNLKVAAFGCVHPSSVVALVTEFQSVWMSSPLSATPNAAP